MKSIIEKSESKKQEKERLRKQSLLMESIKITGDTLKVSFPKKLVKNGEDLRYVLESGFSYIEANPKITKLDLSGLPGRGEGKNKTCDSAGLLMSFLSDNKTINSLNLSNSKIMSEILDLVSYLSPSITSVNLSGCGLGDYRVGVILCGTGSLRLENLDLSNNNIGLYGCRAISKYIATNEKLKFLNLSNNPEMFKDNNARTQFVSAMQGNIGIIELNLDKTFKDVQSQITPFVKRNNPDSVKEDCIKKSWLLKEIFDANCYATPSELRKVHILPALFTFSLTEACVINSYSMADKKPSDQIGRFAKRFEDFAPNKELFAQAVCRAVMEDKKGAITR